MIIDVSSIGQGAINWSQADPAIDGAYIKTTEGTNFVDPRWMANHDGVVAGNKPAGAYHFADLANPIAEANHFADEYLKRTWQLRPVLDIETTGVTGDWIKQFMAQFRYRTSSQAFRVYSSLSLLTGPYDPAGWIDSNSDIWVAAYRSVLGWNHPKLVLWQNTDAAHVPGIVGNVDGDQYMNGWNPAKDTGPAPIKGEHVSYELTVPAGTDEHFVLPCAGAPQFWYIGASYGRKVEVHQVDYIMPTQGSGPVFAPGGFNDGSLTASGFNGPNSNTWTFVSDQPGPVGISTLNGAQPVAISIRYSADYPFTAWVG